MLLFFPFLSPCSLIICENYAIFLGGGGNDTPQMFCGPQNFLRSDQNSFISLGNEEMCAQFNNKQL